MAGADRERLLDVLRGFAVCGILLMNIQGMGRPWRLYRPSAPLSPAAPDWQAYFVSELFIEGAMRGLFTLLFGASMLLLLSKPQSPGAPAPADLHYRRALALVAFGVGHAVILLWPGDVLFIYGVAALFLFPLRLLGPRMMFALAAIILTVLTLGSLRTAYNNAQNFEAGVRAEAASQAGRTLSDAEKQALASRQAIIEGRNPTAAVLAEERAAVLGPYLETLRYQIDAWRGWATNIYGAALVFESLAFMLIGAGLLKLGVMTGRAPLPLYLALALGGYALGVGLRAVELASSAQTGFAPGHVELRDATHQISRLGLTLGHLGLIALIWRGGVGDWIGRGLEALGRMALTNYLMQSAIAALLFFGFGFGLFGRFSVFELWGICVLIFVGQALFSLFWLSRFQLGPAEWILRCISYWRILPLLRAQSTFSTKV